MSRLLGIALLVACAGCGDDASGVPPDGPPASDARPDSAVGDAPAGDVPAVDAPPGDARPDTIAPPDATLSDAGMFTTPVTPNSVGCAVAGGACGTTTSKCCGMLAGGMLAFTCAPLATSGCAIDESCDGTEDCAAGVCCGMGNTMTGFRTACAPAPCPANSLQLCHNHTQCPAAQSSCCLRRVGGVMASFGLCYAPGTEPAGARCDTP